MPSTGDQLRAGAEHHEAAGCRHEDLQMEHMEEGTEKNLHSGYMVYMMVFMEVGVGAGGTYWTGGPPARDMTSGPGRRGRASEGMSICPLRWTYGQLQAGKADF